VVIDDSMFVMWSNLYRPSHANYRHCSWADGIFESHANGVFALESQSRWDRRSKCGTWLGTTSWFQEG
jgi:hypothetical protein